MNHEEWCHKKIELLESILAEVKRYNSKIYDQAISKVKASGKYEDSMFEDIEG
jgi:hypothetical protein